MSEQEASFDDSRTVCHRIEVLNRIEAEEYDCPYAWGCISITTTEEDLADIPKENRVAILRLVFADLTHPWGNYILFDDEHAFDILDFVTMHWNRMGTLMVHCDAGISRSSAVAAAISRLKFGEEGEFVDPPFDPNPRVYRILREVATGRADYQDVPDYDDDRDFTDEEDD